MPGPYRRKRHHTATKINSRQYKTKFRTKDEDEIHDDMKEENVYQLLNQEQDIDKPGEGQFYCLHCARYFIDNHTLEEHFKTKAHKKRIKKLRVDPYSIEESERAAGFGSVVLPSDKTVRTQPSKEEIKR